MEMARENENHYGKERLRIETQEPRDSFVRRGISNASAGINSQ